MMKKELAMPQIKPIYETSFTKARPLKRGKVRDIYDAGENLVVVATDRLSAYDVVFGNPIPWKGIVLSQLSKFWSNGTRYIIENDLVSTQVSALPKEFSAHEDVLRGRVSLVKKAIPFGNRMHRPRLLGGIRLPSVPGNGRGLRNTSQEGPEEVGEA